MKIILFIALFSPCKQAALLDFVLGTNILKAENDAHGHTDFGH